MPNLVEPNLPVAAPPVAPEVQPLDSANPAPPPVEAGAEQAESLPDEVLQIPAFQAIMSGQPPAVSASIKAFDNRPEGEVIAQNQAVLNQAGIGFYRSLDGDIGVIFNQLFISGEDLQKADKEGRLNELAPPFDDVNAAVLEAGPDNPIMGMQGVSGGPAGEVPQPPQSGSPIPPTSGLAPSAQKSLVNKRAKNLQPGSPSEGARPGGGRLLNSILKNPI